MSAPINPKTVTSAEDKLRTQFQQARDIGHTHMLVYQLITLEGPFGISGYGYHSLLAFTPKVDVIEAAVSFDATDPATHLNILSLMVSQLCRAETGDVNPCYKAPEKVFYGVYDLSKPFDDARISYKDLPNQAVETIDDLMYKEREQKKGPLFKLLEKVFG